MTPTRRGGSTCSPTCDGSGAHGLAGWTNLVWILDVAGSRVIISASHGRDVTPAQEAELVGIVESVSFNVP